MRLKLAVVLVCAGWSAAAFALDRLVWQDPNQTNKVEAGAVSTHFVFKVRNVSKERAVIDALKPSCGCTVAQLPSNPWKIAPGKTSQFEALVDVRGKTGLLFKTIDVIAGNVTNTLHLAIDIAPGAGTISTQMQNRLWGQQLAATDRQAVFKKECVNCHLTPAFGKSGEPLYHTACGICHEAEHRATMVPDLRALNTPIDTNYWRNIVANGKPGTLMPAFAATQGGPLDDDQIDSLAEYLTKTFPRPMQSTATSLKAH